MNDKSFHATIYARNKKNNQEGKFVLNVSEIEWHKVLSLPENVDLIFAVIAGEPKETTCD